MKNVDNIKAPWTHLIGGAGDVATGTAYKRQCIYLILFTPLGAVTLEPTFGSRIPEYVDLPVNKGVPKILREAYRVLRKWGKRFNVTRIRARVTGERVSLIVTTTSEEEIYEVPK